MKKLFLTFIILCSVLLLSAQEPVRWDFSSKKVGDNTYEVSFQAKVNAPWHIYSQATPDGGPLPTSFSFNKNPMLTLEGKMIEKGKVINKFEEVFEIDVKYFEGNANFVQIVKVKGNVKTNLSGTVSYMACTDEQCLPPTDVKFNISLQ